MKNHISDTDVAAMRCAASTGTQQPADAPSSQQPQLSGETPPTGSIAQPAPQLSGETSGTNTTGLPAQQDRRDPPKTVSAQKSPAIDDNDDAVSDPTPIFLAYIRRSFWD